MAASISDPMVDFRNYCKREGIKSEDLEVIKTIGAGAFGTVKLVRHKLTKYLLASKTIQSETSMKEFEIAQAFDHPRLIKTFGYEKIDSFLKLFLEYAPNGDLRNKLRQEKQLSEKETAFYIIQILEGVVYLHSMNVMHGDLKPENILLDEAGNVKLCDFRNSRILHAESQAGTYTGTVYYMSPEACASDTYTRKANIWNLGIITIELLTGELPWGRLEGVQIIYKHVQGVAPEYNLPNNTTKELAEFVSTTLEKESSRPSAASLMEHSWIKYWTLKTVLGDDNVPYNVAATLNKRKPRSSVMLKWDEPKVKPLEYIVYWIPKQGKAGNKRVRECHDVLQNLKSNTEYQFVVQAVYENDTIFRVKSNPITTQRDIVEAQYKLDWTYLSEESGTNNQAVKIYWTKPTFNENDEDFRVLEFRLFVTQSNTNLVIFDTTLDTDVLSEVLHELKAGTTYFAELKVMYEEIDSKKVFHKTEKIHIKLGEMEQPSSTWTADNSSSDEDENEAENWHPSVLSSTDLPDDINTRLGKELKAMQNEKNKEIERKYAELQKYNRMKQEWIDQGLIGRGAFGSVYKVTNGKSVRALKQVKWNSSTKPSKKSSFDEVEILNSLDHENIVKIEDICFGEGDLWIYMEFAPNGNLEELLKQEGSIDENDARKYSVQLLKAIEYLHSKNVIHRDVKPANILLDGSTIKLSDFGVSKLFEQHAGCNTVVGTPMYRSPELMAGKYGLKTDIWSVGCVVLQMITNQPPWFDFEAPQVMSKLSDGMHPIIPPSLPQALKKFLERTFLKEDQRPTATDLLNSDWIITGFDRSHSTDGSISPDLDLM